MYNSHDDMTAFHNSDVQLGLAERNTMRDRRNTNRKRLKDGLKRDGEPKPVGCHTQGSYAMRTMTQHAELDYDIDDGVYFEKDDLKGANGGDKSPGSAKEMVRTAVHDERFNEPPACLKNCVRVYYDEGYHVDIPIYRRFLEYGDYVYERAASEWRRADPRAVTKWFNDANASKSPNTDNYGQMNRLVKLLKAFARSRSSWRAGIATGFMISVLVDEQYLALDNRDDQALRDVMRAIHTRLDTSLVINHPVLDEAVTRGDDDSRARIFKDKLAWALDQLAVLDEWNCTEANAKDAWDCVFNTTFFNDRGAAKKAEATVTAASVLVGTSQPAEQAFDKRGGGRFG